VTRDRESEEPNEAAWVGALKGREAWAWERLQAVALERVFRYLLLRVGRREEAEDLTAEVFAAAVAGIDQYRGGASVVTWLIGIARRKLADARRFRRRHPETLAAELPEGVTWDALLAEVPDAGALLPADEIARRERLLAVRRLVLRLPEPQREALWLRSVEELSVAEVARVLERTPDAVRGLLHRARTAVRIELEGEERCGSRRIFPRTRSPRRLKERADAEP
jgi:RNA polymerase sigma-70 factor (ECF subfamily)